MKNIITALFVLCLIGSVQATEVAVVDFRAALLQSNIGQTASEGPKKQIAEMDARLKKEQTDFQALIEGLKRDELTLAPEDVQKRRQALAEKQNQIRAMAQSMQQQAKQLEQQLIQSLTPKAEAALKSLIEERKLDLVLNRQLSLFANSDADITDELVERINKDN